MKKPAPHECGTGQFGVSAAMGDTHSRWGTLSVRKESHGAYSTHEAASSSATTANYLQGANVLGLGSLGALGEVEFDLLVLVKRLVAA